MIIGMLSWGENMVREQTHYFERYANKNGRDIPLVSLSQVEWKMFGMHMHN